MGKIRVFFLICGVFILNIYGELYGIDSTKRNFYIGGNLGMGFATGTLRKDFKTAPGGAVFVGWYKNLWGVEMEFLEHISKLEMNEITMDDGEIYMSGYGGFMLYAKIYPFPKLKEKSIIPAVFLGTGMLEYIYVYSGKGKEIIADNKYMYLKRDFIASTPLIFGVNIDYGMSERFLIGINIKGIINFLQKETFHGKIEHGLTGNTFLINFSIKYLFGISCSCCGI